MRVKYLNGIFSAALMLLMFVPVMAYADAGTPLLWLTFGHLVAGNAIIGLIEGLIISGVYKVKYISSILIMILANYVSMALGIIGILFCAAAFRNHVSINNAAFVLLLFLLGSYMATVIIEWPFCLWILKRKADRGRLSFKASVILQAISYAILIPLYFMASGFTLATRTKVDNPSVFIKSNNARIYFRGLDGKDIYKINADGRYREKVNEFKSPDDVLVNASNREKYDVRSWQGVVDLRPENKRYWYVRTGNWAINGLSGENIKSGERLWLALETPFLSWLITNATILPEEQVICQVGGNQIVLIDLNTRQIGLIAFGREPIVIIE